MSDFDPLPAMALALALARDAAVADEVPVGAVIVRLSDGAVVGRGRERKVELSDPTAHAEVLALRDAARALGDWRLEGHALVVTLEPCLMCAGAALLARVELVVFGASNPKFGAMGGLADPLSAPGWNHRVRVEGGVMADESAALLKSYFAAKRVRPNTPPDVTR